MGKEVNNNGEKGQRGGEKKGGLKKTNLERKALEYSES